MSYAIAIKWDDDFIWMLDDNLDAFNVKTYDSYDEAIDAADKMELTNYEVYQYPLQISYSTNWMGPITLQWYKDRGLTKTVSKVLEEDQAFGKLKKGDVFEYEDITEHYACGRIDIRGVPFEPYGLEYSLGVMKATSWNKLSEWFDGFRSEYLLSYDELIKQFETETGHKIDYHNE